ncbi:MAG: stage II sporulation protein M [Actinobacteria bacterium]|nr:stage II sporulation protein M [Actinomycetota bacterium]
MTLDGFLTAREPDWQRLRDALRRARGRPERLGAAGALELGALYRSAAADLAVARRRFPGEPVIDRLETLVADGRQAVYGRRAPRRALRAFIGTGYWREVRKHPGALALAWIALTLPAVLAAAWALADPGAAIGLVPAQFRGVAGAPVHHDPLSAADQAALASDIFTNNIRVTLVAFAGGLTLGALTVGIVAYNGILLGVLAGLTLGNGNFATFVRYVAPHGLLELSCIAVGAAAGLRVAWSVIDPGDRRSRGESLREASRDAVVLVLGTAVWLVVAGLTEGFLTPRGVGLGTALAVGVGLAGLYWALVIVRGRPPVTDGPAPLPGGTPARTGGPAGRPAPRSPWRRGGRAGR